MHLKRNWKCAGLLLMALMLVLGWSATAQSKATVSGTETVRQKVDLRVTSIRAERIGVTPSGAHQVRVSVQVSCFGNFPGGAGPFRIKCEASDSISAAYSLLGESNITGLGTGYASVAMPTETRTFEENVPAGHTRHYRGTVDPTGMIDEANEMNNTANTRYTASGCPGSDLVLTQIEMIRGSHGGVLFHVWVRNRCVVNCRGTIYYDVTPISPAGHAIEQEISADCPGETTFGPLGTMLATGISGVELTYDVHVSVSGGTCRETSTTNNTYRVILGASEARKTVFCRY